MPFFITFLGGFVLMSHQDPQAQRLGELVVAGTAVAAATFAIREE